MFRTMTWLIVSPTEKKQGQVANVIRECGYRTWQQVGDEVKAPLEQNRRSIFNDVQRQTLQRTNKLRVFQTITEH